jgi:putative transposase
MNIDWRRELAGWHFRHPHVVHEYIDHYNGHRPHRSLGQLPPQPKAVAPAVLRKVDPSRLKRTDRIGGVIHEYRLAA